MKKPISFGSIGFELVASLDEAKAAPASGDPFRICVLSDFTGRVSRGIRESLAARKTVPVDRDSIDEVIVKIKPRVALDVLDQKIDVSFDSLDSFHPDELFSRIELFRSLKDTRRKLGDPRTHNAALKELRVLIGEEEGQETTRASVQERPEAPQGNILDRIVSDTKEGTLEKSGRTGRGDLADFVDAIVKPYRVAAKDPSEDRIREAFDAYISLLMAEVLHSARMQEIEAAWRGLHFLVSRVETDEDLEISILDISKEEFSKDLLTADDLGSTNIYRLFVKQPLMSPEGKPWAVIVGDYQFDHDDVEVLGRMARIASAAGAPFIAGAHPRLFGCASLADTPDSDQWNFRPGLEVKETWEALRALPEAVHLGLAAPRFLLRLPYGASTDPVKVFDFEETAGKMAHEDYLWGNPAFACAYLLSAAFSRKGWSMMPGVISDIDDLPQYVTVKDGEKSIIPTAEVLLTDKALEAILDAGVMPLATIRNTDTARLVRFQSIAEPPTGLKGRWGSS